MSNKLCYIKHKVGVDYVLGKMFFKNGLYLSKCTLQCIGTMRMHICVCGHKRIDNVHVTQIYTNITCFV